MTTEHHPCAGCGNVIPADVKWCGGCGGEEEQQRANRIALFRDLIVNPDTDDPVAPPVAAVLADFEANVRAEERLRVLAVVRDWVSTGNDSLHVEAHEMSAFFAEVEGRECTP